MPVSTAAASTLLRGRNSVVKPELNRQVALAGDPLPSGSGPLTSDSAITVCRTASALSRSLHGEVGVSAGLAALPIPLLQFRREFQQSLHTTTFSVSVVVQARRIVESLEVVQPSLLPGVVLPGDTQQLDQFVALYGDSWISGVQLGAEVQGVYTLYAQSRQEADALAQRLDAIVPLSGVAITPAFAQQLRTLTSDLTQNISARVQVKGVPQPSLSSPEELLDLVSRFGSLPIAQPELLAVVTRGYEELPQLLPLFQPVVANRRLFCGNPATPSLPGLQHRKAQLEELSNQCRWVADTCRIYGQTPDPSLQTNRHLIKDDIAAIEALAAAYDRSASTPLQPPALTALRCGSPRLTPTVRPGLALGGQGGEPFAFRDRDQAIQRRRRLRRVGLRSGRLIDQIRLTYSQEADGLIAATKPQEWTEVHGGTGGDDRGNLELGDGTLITSINANTGTGVDELEFISSGGERLQGGRPSNGGRASSWTVGPQQVLLGFQGRAETWLDALQPLIADFSDALHWEEVDENDLS